MQVTKLKMFETGIVFYQVYFQVQRSGAAGLEYQPSKVVAVASGVFGHFELVWKDHLLKV